jgi:hypothetical protein
LFDYALSDWVGVWSMLSAIGVPVTCSGDLALKLQHDKQ